MQAAMERLDAFVQRRRRLVVGLWVAVLLVSVPFSALQSKHLTEGGFDSPGSDSNVASDTLRSEFGPENPNNFGVILQRAGDAPRSALVDAVERYARIADSVEHIEVPASGVAQARERARRADVVIFPLLLRGGPEESINSAVELRKELGVGEGAREGVRPYLVGVDAMWAALHELQTEDLTKAERIGIPITAIILLATFGTLAAAALPLALAIASVTITGAAVFFLAQLTPMSIFVTSSASMLGIGVAIDYSLFVVARYRQEIRAGHAPAQARRIAMRGSGLAVVFSGLTVIVALGATLTVDSTVLRSMGIGAIIVVAISVLAAVTLLPILLDVLGRRVYEPGRVAAIRGRVLGALRRERRPGQADFWTRWTHWVMRRPVLVLVATSAAMLAMALPALDIDLRTQTNNQFPPDHEARQGQELAEGLIGPGALGPIEGVATFREGDLRTPANRAALDRYVQEIESDPEVAHVVPPRPSEDGRSATLTVVPRHHPESDEAVALLERLRERADRPQGLPALAAVHYGGEVALVEDFAALVGESVPPVLSLLVALTFLVLLVMLRSVWLPIKAILVNLLTVAATCGVMVAIFQWGWLAPLGVGEVGYVEAIVPPLLVAVVFGLSMDYEIFMLARIREVLAHEGDDRRAVARGLRETAGTITSAALVLISVFLAFAAVSLPSIRMIGTGLAVAIALDVTVVRLLLVPATMALLGRWNWWLPGPLDRRLPHFDLEARAVPAGDGAVARADGGVPVPVDGGADGDGARNGSRTGSSATRGTGDG